MKEIFRHKDIVTIYYYKNLLNSEGIQIMLRNEFVTTSGITEVPIPEFYPNICVMNDDDYPRAWEILNKALNENAKNVDIEVICPNCKETNPGNFEMCFACDSDLAHKPS